MPETDMRFIKRCAEYRKKAEWADLQKGLRGIYFLFKKRRSKAPLGTFDVRYIGMSKGTGGGIRARIKSHTKGIRKIGEWDYFSVLEVADNLKDAEIAELEGLFLHFFRRDRHANVLNRQKGYGKLVRLRNATDKTLFSE